MPYVIWNNTIYVYIYLSIFFVIYMYIHTFIYTKVSTDNPSMGTAAPRGPTFCEKGYKKGLKVGYGPPQIPTLEQQRCLHNELSYCCLANPNKPTSKS